MIEIYQDNSGYWHFHANGHTSNQLFSYQEAAEALREYLQKKGPIAEAIELCADTNEPCKSLLA
jgi:hypothetical protein